MNSSMPIEGRDVDGAQGRHQGKISLETLKTLRDRSRYPTRKLTLEDEGKVEIVGNSPAERLEMMWPLTLQVWEFATWNQPSGDRDESRLRRDVGRVIRPAS